MSWFRFYTDVLNDPKVQRLPAETFRAWVNLLCLAKEHDGVLPDLPDVAFALRVSEEEAGGWLDELESRGLLDRDELSRRFPHNWEGRQYASDSSTERVRRHRAKRAADTSLNMAEPLPANEGTLLERSRNGTEQSRAETEQSRADNETVYTNSGAVPPLLLAFEQVYCHQPTAQEARQIAALYPVPDVARFTEALTRAKTNNVQAVIPWVSKRLADTHPNGTGPPLAPKLVSVEDHLAAGPRRGKPHG